VTAPIGPSEGLVIDRARTGCSHRNGDSTAPFAPESQFFLDHLVAGRPNGFRQIRIGSQREGRLGRPAAAFIISCLPVRRFPVRSE
jgi:hypothetical protein